MTSKKILRRMSEPEDTPFYKEIKKGCLKWLKEPSNGRDITELEQDPRFQRYMLWRSICRIEKEKKRGLQ